jgi:hypothetical protein
VAVSRIWFASRREGEALQLFPCSRDHVPGKIRIGILQRPCDSEAADHPRNQRDRPAPGFVRRRSGRQRLLHHAGQLLV